MVLDPQSTWRMLNEGRLPAHLQVERIGRLWYVILPDEAPALLTVGYARVSSHEQKDLSWSHKPITAVGVCRTERHCKLDRVVSEVASGLNDRRPEVAPTAVGSQGGLPYWLNIGTAWRGSVWAWWTSHAGSTGWQVCW